MENNWDEFVKTEKIYRGSYEYLNNGRVYAEESFEVFRDNHELTYTFNTEIHSRVATGELLTVTVEYIIGKDYIPKRVEIDKTLGKEHINEIFEANNKVNVVKYFFSNNEESHESQISTPPRYHITSPASCSSLLFILSKKFDTTSKNDYTIISSLNQWEYKSDLVSKSLSMKKLSATPDVVDLDDKKLTGDYYELFNFDNDDNAITGKQKEEDNESIKIFLSKHMAIPYILEGQNNTNIQIKFLNHLDSNA